MTRFIRQWLARRHLARMCRENVAKIAASQPRHPDGRFARKPRTFA